MGQAERNKRATWVQAFWHASDLLAIEGGFLLGYWTRFHSPLTAVLPPEKGIPPLSLYFYGSLITAVFWIPLMHAGGLYRLERGRPRHRRHDIVRVQALGMMIVAALSFFYRDQSFSRLAVSLIWVFSVALTILGRDLLKPMPRRWSRLQPIRFAVVGGGPLAERLARKLEESVYPHACAGVFDAGEAEGGLLSAAGGSSATSVLSAGGASSAPAAGTVPARAAAVAEAPLPPSPGWTSLTPLGSAAHIRERAPALGLDLVVLAAPSADPALFQAVFAQCQELDLDFLFVPDLQSFWGRPMRVEEVDGLPVIRLRDLTLVGWNGVLKRSFDLAGSALLLVLFSPLFLVLALAVKLDSPGPVFHRQERVGRDRRPFGMLKFRSMRVGAEAATGPVWASHGDPRRTRTGAFLRKWSLDELPQLWNVFRGEMSLVGPRPERPFFVHQFEARVADYYDRHRVKSGVTGWAQVHGLRGDVPIEERTRYDLYYVENWSLALDLRILWLTVAAVFRHRGE